MTDHYTLDQAFYWSAPSRSRNNMTNMYEPLQPYLLSEMANALGMKIFIDIGANIGLYSIILTEEIKAEKVLAFEPMPGPFCELNKNIELNNLSNKIHPFNIALSDERGSAQISVISEFSGANALTKSTIHSEKTPIRFDTVETGKLDDFIKSAGEYIAIKIDVEGHEKQVIDGACTVLRSNYCLIQLEDYEGTVASELFEIGYKLIFRAGPDYYFTNHVEVDDIIMPALESAITRYIVNHKARPIQRENVRIRRKIFPGLTIELSQALSNQLRRLVNR